MTAPGKRLAIVATGHTAQGEHPGRSAGSLQAEAIKIALGNAKLRKEQIDGLITCKQLHGDGSDDQVVPRVGMHNLRYTQTLDYGTCNFSLHQAQMALEAGVADLIAISYGTNQRTNRYQFGAGANSGPAAFTTPYGWTHIAGQAAMALRRWQHVYGLTEEQFGHIAVSQRAWAQRNPQAIFKQSLTMEEYLAQPMMVDPMRRADVTMISDGGVSYIVTTEEKAYDYTDKPIIMAGWAEAGASSSFYGENFMRPWLKRPGQEIWERSGIDRADVDVVYVQDPTAVWPLQMLSYYGFAEPGDIGAWLAEGHTYPGGDVPVNTNGGQLSEAYMWGWLHVVEAVRQLRGEADAERQVKDAKIALYASTMAWNKGGASVLVRGE